MGQAQNGEAQALSIPETHLKLGFDELRCKILFTFEEGITNQDSAEEGREMSVIECHRRKEERRVRVFSALLYGTFIIIDERDVITSIIQITHQGLQDGEVANDS